MPLDDAQIALVHRPLHTAKGAHSELRGELQDSPHPPSLSLSLFRTQKNHFEKLTMGRKAASVEEKKAKQRERRDRYLSNSEKLTRKREQARLRQEGLRRQARLIAHDPLAPLADEANRAETLKAIEILDRIHGPISSIGNPSVPVVEEMEVGTAEFEDDGLVLTTMTNDAWHEGTSIQLWH